MPMSAPEVVGIDTRDPEGGGCYLVKVADNESGEGGRGSAEPYTEADAAGGGSTSASVGAQQAPGSPNHHFNVQESTLVISNSSTCTLKLQSSGPFSKKNKNYTVQFNKETTKTTTSSQVRRGWDVLICVYTNPLDFRYTSKTAWPWKTWRWVLLIPARVQALSV